MRHSEFTHRLILSTGYLAGFSALVYLVVHAYPYYELPLPARPHHPLHQLIKPGGKIGHGLGVTGSLMILLLFLYTLRKRGVIRWGSLSHWLNVHIMFGILGPLFVTFHTAFKFGGIVSVSYFSMVAVMLSGIFGRYLYIQIPRAITGGELTSRDINARREEIRRSLSREFNVGNRELESLEATLIPRARGNETAIRVLFSLLLGDLLRPVRLMSIKRALRSDRPGLTRGERDRLVAWVREDALLLRKTGFLLTIRRVFYYWHVVHRPFAYVMVLIMLIHVAVVTHFGYRWIF